MWYTIPGETTPFDQRSFVTLGTQFGAAGVALLVGAVVLSPAVTVVEAVLATSLLVGGLFFILAGRSSRPNLLAWRTLAAAGYGSIGAGLLVAWAGLVGPGSIVIPGATGVVAAAVNWWIALELLRDSDRYSIESPPGARPSKSPLGEPATERT